MQYEEVLRRELTILTNYPEGLQRAITAVEECRIDGADPAWCFYGYFINPIDAYRKDRIQHAADLYYEMRKNHAYSLPGSATYIETAVIHMVPGQTLSEEGQAFLALCKQVYAEVCSPQATGSEG